MSTTEVRGQRAEMPLAGPVSIEVISPDTYKYLKGELAPDVYFQRGADEARREAEHEVEQVVGR